MILISYTAQEDAELIAYRAAGLPWDQISAKMTIRSPSALRARYIKLTKPACEPAPPPEVFVRKCSLCRKTFDSPSRYIWRCNACKDRHDTTEHISMLSSAARIRYAS